MTCINNMLDDRHGRFMRSKNGKTPRATVEKYRRPWFLPSFLGFPLFQPFFFFPPPSCSVLEVINLDVEDGKLGTSSLKTLRAGQVSLNERAFTGFSVFSAAAEVTILGQERK